MGVTKFDETTGAQLREIVAGGTASFKVFLAYKGAFGIDDTELYHTLKLARSLASSSRRTAKTRRSWRNDSASCLPQA